MNLAVKLVIAAEMAEMFCEKRVIARVKGLIFRNLKETCRMQAEIPKN